LTTTKFRSFDLWNDCDAEGIDFARLSSEEIEDLIWEKLKARYAGKEKQIGEEAMRTYERIIMLNIIDAQWKDHLLALDHFKQGIGLVGYGQKESAGRIQERELRSFPSNAGSHRYTTIRSLFNLQVVSEQAPDRIARGVAPARRSSMNFTGPNQGAAAGGEEAGNGPKPSVRSSHKKVGAQRSRALRFAEKKYKKCHGAI